MKSDFILIGDSLTFGYGVNYNQRWTSLLSNKLVNYNVINKGINGNTSANILFRFYDDVISLNPEYIFIMCGTNDLLCGRSLKNIVDNIEEMIIEGINIKSKIIIGIPPHIIKEMAYSMFTPSPFYDYCNDSLKDLKKQLIDLCNKYKINYINFYDLLTNNSAENLYLDGIHFNCLGNKIIFNVVISELNSILNN